MDDERLRSCKYEFKQLIGSGSFSDVWHARHKDTGERVAIKRLRHVFKSEADAKHVLREIRLLKHFRHENIIPLRDVIRPAEGAAHFQDIYLVFELMATDLGRVISAKMALRKEHYVMFIYQILRGLRCVHSAGVLHRDLKPSNLLANRSCDLKICDFGMGRGQSEDGGRAALQMTQLEVCTTRWYRAPEGLLGAKHYTAAVDVWSVGCIAAELLGGEPLFPGQTNYDMLELVYSYAGTPSSEDVGRIENDRYREFVKSLPPKNKSAIGEHFPQLKGVEPQALDLIERMLVCDPSRRISVEGALAHPWLEDLHDPADEPTALPFLYNMEQTETTAKYRELIYNELMSL